MSLKDRCASCGYERGKHNAMTKACPLVTSGRGSKRRTIYMMFSRFIEKKERQP